MRIVLALALASALAASPPAIQEPAAKDAATRARELTIPVQVQESGKIVWSSGVPVHVAGKTGVIAFPLERIQFHGLNLSKATFTCRVAGKAVDAALSGRSESWKIGFLRITADGLPEAPPFMPDPQAVPFVPTTKLVAGGLATGGDKDRQEAGAGLEATCRSFGGVGAHPEVFGQTMQYTVTAGATDPLGGPLLDPEGRLAGVTIEVSGGNPRFGSYAALTGSAIDFLLKGIALEWKAEIAAREAGVCRIKIAGAVCNPLGIIHEARAGYVFEKVNDRMNGPHAPGLDGMLRGPFHPLMREARLELAGDKFTGEIAVAKPDAEGKDCVMQIRLLRRGAYSFYSRAKFLTPEYAVGAAPAGDDWMESDAAKKREDSALLGRLAVRRMTNVDALFTKIDLPADEIVPDPLWGDEGKTLFVLEKKGRLRRISVPNFEEQLGQELGFECASLKMSREGILVHGRLRPEIVVVDPATLQVKKRIVVAAFSSLAASASSSLAFAPVAKEHAMSTELQIVDLVSGQVAGTQQFQTLNEQGRPSGVVVWMRASLSPDGKFLIGWDHGSQLHRFRVSGRKVLHEESRGMSGPSSDDDQVQWSPDSLYFAVPQRIDGGRTLCVFKTSKLQEPVLKIKASGWGPAVGFDFEAKALYGPGTAKALAVYDPLGVSKKEYTLWPDLQSYVRILSVHPEGRRAFVVGKGIALWVEFPK